MSRFGLNKLIVTTFLPFFFRIFTNQTVHWDFSWNVSHEERLFQHEPVCIDSFISGCHVVFVSFGLIIWGFCKHVTRYSERRKETTEMIQRSRAVKHFCHFCLQCFCFCRMSCCMLAEKKAAVPKILYSKPAEEPRPVQADSLGTRVTNRRG